ncbi:hypothetical protein [Paenibacillus sp. GP183]|uniref:hypothetical protein n=1 Tax=Paenibacillus sp. GP183 TaxID=1882751 RepID=UPI00089A767E|nr:hypothetical protein [Paenibacillus sp. GP183]SEC47142.1 hypothetical protein SAMN05443246_4218 [Paenibacillus sp. GP183]
MNSQIRSKKYQQISEELNAILGYDIVNNLQELEISELAKLRESLSRIESYLHNAMLN